MFVQFYNSQIAMQLLANNIFFSFLRCLKMLILLYKKEVDDIVLVRFFCEKVTLI